MGIKTFLMEPTMTRRFYLRRYGNAGACPKSPWGDGSCDTSMHELRGHDESFTWVVHSDGYKVFPDAIKIADDDARWPTKCAHCGAELSPGSSRRQVMQEHLYRRTDTGELVAHRFFPPGALYYEDGPHYGFASVFPGGGPDGKVLCAVCPGGARWCIDSRASNCTKRDDNMHRCWVRHGDPRDGSIHVDKSGVTCEAGVGSIQTGNWHGFLHHGEFV